MGRAALDAYADGVWFVALAALATAEGLPSVIASALSVIRHGADPSAALLGDLNREEGVALVYVTHAADLAAKAGKVYDLKDGRLAPR